MTLFRKEALKGSEAVKSAVEKLNQSAMKIGQEVYQNAQPLRPPPVRRFRKGPPLPPMTTLSTPKL